MRTQHVLLAKFACDPSACACTISPDLASKGRALLFSCGWQLTAGMVWQQCVLNRVFDTPTKGMLGASELGNEDVRGIAFQTSHTRDFKSYTIQNYKKLSDLRYIKHCRENRFPAPEPPKRTETTSGNDVPTSDVLESRGCGTEAAAMGEHRETTRAQRTGHALYVQNDVLGEERLEEELNSTMDEVTTEREFWHTMSTSNNFSVQYANDIEGTASSSFGAWDLSKMPTSSSCLLNLLPDLIPGVTTPMLYIGMLFAHFCWHYEDNALYSINCMHAGAPKTWYVVPGSAAADLEKAADDVFANHPDRYHPLMHGAHMLMRKTVIMSPSVLLARGVPVFRATQRPRDIIVTFPRGYHSGFNHGFHTGEAINFAMPDWIPYGLASLERYRAVGLLSVIDMERLVLDMAHCLTRFKAHSTGSPSSLHISDRAQEHGHAPVCVRDVGRYALGRENGVDARLVWRDTPQRAATNNPNLMSPKDATAQVQVRRDARWVELMDREASTALLWTVRALAAWQLRVDQLARASPAIHRVKFMDEKHRHGTGEVELDRYLCCGCNHILHTAWIEQDDGGHDDFTDDKDDPVSYALRPRACPDHLEFLGGSAPLCLVMRYSHEEMQKLLEGLQGLLPVSLALPAPEVVGSEAAGGGQTTVTREWPLRGLEGSSLGLTLRVVDESDLASAGRKDNGVASAATPPTPVKCGTCRCKRADKETLNAQEDDDLDVPLARKVKADVSARAFAQAPVFAMDHERSERSQSRGGSSCALANRSAACVECASACAGWAGDACAKKQGAADRVSAELLHRTHTPAELPQSPLYRHDRRLFPTLKMLLSNSRSRLHVACQVTPAIFRKHLLRLKPELKALVPGLASLAQADAEGEEAVASAVAHDSSHVPARVPTPVAAPQRVDEMLDPTPNAAPARCQTAHDTRSCERQGVPKQERHTAPTPLAAVHHADSESDDDVPLAQKMSKMAGVHKKLFDARSKATTAAGQIQTHRPSPKMSGCCLVASDETNASRTYGRKRWKIIEMDERRRDDGSWAMTLRLKRKRNRHV